MGKRSKSGPQGAGQRNAAVLIFPPFLYLGPCSAASSSSFLTSNGIIAVISIGSTPSEKVDGVTYHRISMADSPSSSISEAIKTTNTIIDSVAEADGKVLVHCSAGISRSPTLIAAYLMSRQDMSLKEALGAIVSARPAVCPNPGFIRQLRDLDTELFGQDSLGVDELPRRMGDRLALLT
ncbi:protein-tyrosine phosphatase-like protein [Dactylonectria macrodidyma]|uniref:Protein-tyrosine phosphatase-like protein n=1 Tax=Dactylonectria macrodidyma TaxID=307937 RepID=A0A9P9CZQ5_9HYPO|nr:protein-tyrosine phosphatase-like protein [Dactylonectria macrodidyma]